MVAYDVCLSIIQLQETRWKCLISFEVFSISHGALSKNLDVIVTKSKTVVLGNLGS